MHLTCFLIGGKNYFTVLNVSCRPSAGVFLNCIIMKIWMLIRMISSRNFAKLVKSDAKPVLDVVTVDQDREVPNGTTFWPKVHRHPVIQMYIISRPELTMESKQNMKKMWHFGEGGVEIWWPTRDCNLLLRPNNSHVQNYRTNCWNDWLIDDRWLVYQGLKQLTKWQIRFSWYKFSKTSNLRYSKYLPSILSSF